MNGRSAHFSLLGAFPAVGMAEDKLKVLLDGAPQGQAIGVCVDDEILCTLEEIAKVIPENLHGRFSLWEVGEAHSIHLEFHGLRPQPKLKSMLTVMNTFKTR